jgi:hypothetical protein
MYITPPARRPADVHGSTNTRPITAKKRVGTVSQSCSDEPSPSAEAPTTARTEAEDLSVVGPRTTQDRSIAQKMGIYIPTARCTDVQGSTDTGPITSKVRVGAMSQSCSDEPSPSAEAPTTTRTEAENLSFAGPRTTQDCSIAQKMRISIPSARSADVHGSTDTGPNSQGKGGCHVPELFGGTKAIC